MTKTDYTETDTTVESQTSYTKAFASGGSFQDVWRVDRGGSEPPCLETSFISNLL